MSDGTERTFEERIAEIAGEIIYKVFDSLNEQLNEEGQRVLNGLFNPVEESDDGNHGNQLQMIIETAVDSALENNDDVE